MDPNQENPEYSGWRLAAEWPEELLPKDVKKDDKQFYAYERVYNDGRHEWVFYRRGKPLPEGQVPEDKPLATVPDRPIKTVRDAYEKEKEKAEKPPAAPTTRNINGVPHQVTGKDESGQEVWAPVQTTTGPAVAATDPNSPTTQESARVRDEKWWNQNTPPNPADPKAGGSGRAETHTERIAREAKEKDDAETKSRQTRIDAEAKAERDRQAERQAAADARTEVDRNKPGAPTLKPDGQGGTIAVQTMPDGTIKTTPLPGVPSDRPTPARVEVGGVTYERGQDGTYAPARGLPSEGQATVGGPPMPEIIVGASEQALRDYHRRLWEDPTLTPAVRERRFQEAIQVANVATANAATAQRERESQRNFDYNVAGTKLNFQQDGLKNAFQLVAGLQLPEGSQLGGKAFAALLGLQMIMLERSGLNRLGAGGAPSATGAPGASAPASAPVPTVTAADLRDPDALEAKRQEIMANPVFRPAEPTNVQPAEPAPVVAPAPAAPPPAVAPGAAPSLVPNPLAPSITDPRDAGGYTGPPAPGGPSAPTAGEPGGPSLAPGPVLGDPPQIPPFVPPDQYQPAAPVNLDPTQGPVGMSPPQPQFAALAQFDSPMTAPGGAPGAAGPVPDMLPPAMRRAQIAATPPWRLDPAEFQWAMENGFDQDALSIPGRRM